MSFKKFSLIAGLSFTLTLSVSAASRTSSKNDKTECFPDSMLSFPSYLKSDGMSKAQFNTVIEKFKRKLASEISYHFSKDVKIEADWENPRVNAHATRDDSNNPVIVINGGMARHPLMTEDALVVVLCHELGHQFGGAPKQLRGNTTKRSWSSAEGQADYYATSKCLPIYFDNEEENNQMLKNLQKDATDKAKLYCGQDAQCLRILASSLTFAQVYASTVNGRKLPQLDERDQVVVQNTIYSHPSPQCRLDTFISGTLCKAGTDIQFDPIDPKIGACQEDSLERALGLGSRPNCWYKPQELFE